MILSRKNRFFFLPFWENLTVFSIFIVPPSALRKRMSLQRQDSGEFVELEAYHGADDDEQPIKEEGGVQYEDFDDDEGQDI